MAERRFSEPEVDGKDLHIRGPGDLYVVVDYDDVNHPVVLEQARRMVRILNEHWERG